jgi:hypothetical protein
MDATQALHVLELGYRDGAQELQNIIMVSFLE